MTVFKKKQKSEHHGQHVIMREGDTCSSATTESEGSEFLSKRAKLIGASRGAFSKVFQSYKYQVLVVSIVIFDCFLIIAEMMLHLKVLNLGEQDRVVACILYYMNLTILCMFLLELTAKVITFRMTIFKQRMDIGDILIVLLCFTLSLTIGGCHRSVNSAGLLIALRLWRISRIFRHMVASVKQEFDRKMAKEERRRTALEREVCKLRDYCLNQEYELQMYRLLLQQNHIALPTVLRMPRTPNTLNVIAEVNDAGASTKCNSSSSNNQ